MGLHLIASSWASTLTSWSQGILGLGFLIFVHELGHFLVAKACGVKCEKFYLGFDIAGWKLLSFTRGETEYGIGILPLGGYVKMLGQDDNPAKAEEEKQRSSMSGDASAPEQLDPRSYLAQSVPERMAIISAGVIMNMIFAVLLGAWAYHRGVMSEKCIIGGTTPGEPAWRADFHPGDEVVLIDNSKSTLPVSYMDLRAAVAVSPSGEPITFQVHRENAEPNVDIHVYPDDRSVHGRKNPTIGVTQVTSLYLIPSLPVEEGSPAAATGKFVTPCEDFELSDAEQYRVTSVNGQPITGNLDYSRAEILHEGEPLRVTVERGHSPKIQGELLDVTAFEVELAPRAVRHLGLAMQLGPVTAVQDNSPAKEAGLKAGDTIVSLAGSPIGDPLDLPSAARALAGKQVDLVIKRPQGDSAEEITLHVTLREAAWRENVHEKVPLSIPSLGVACQVIPAITAVDPAGPAATAGVQAGDQVNSATVLYGESQTCKDFKKSADKASKKREPAEIDLAHEKGSWPGLMAALQESPPETKVRLTLKSGKEVTLAPILAKDKFVADRGFNFQPLVQEVQAASIPQALEWGYLETKKQSTQVYSMVRSLVTGRVSASGLGGIGTIVSAASANASVSFSMLLIFLTSLSANLAVINMLPIPVLDGGHMLFLLYEAVFRRKPNEHVQGALTWMGLVFILLLVVFVNGNDVVQFVGGLIGK